MAYFLWLILTLDEIIFWGGESNGDIPFVICDIYEDGTKIVETLISKQNFSKLFMLEHFSIDTTNFIIINTFIF